MNKKFFAGLTAMALVTAMALPAAATPGSSTQTTDLTTFKDSSYTLTIPTSTEVSYGATSTNIGILKVVGNVDVGNSVTVDAVLHNFTRTGSTSDEIAFSLKDTSGESAKDFAATTWSEDDLRNASPKTVPLSVDITQQTWDGAKAGSYTGSITFTATYNVPADGGIV